MPVDRADAADEPVGRCALDQLLERAPAALRGDDERRVLDEAALVDEVGDVLPRRALPASRDGARPRRAGGGRARHRAARAPRRDRRARASRSTVDGSARSASPRRRRRRVRSTNASASPGITVSPTAIGDARHDAGDCRRRRRAPSSSTRARRVVARRERRRPPRRRSTRRCPASVTRRRSWDQLHISGGSASPRGLCALGLVRTVAA